MLEINYNPSLYVFTCNIPSEIEISSDAASVYVTIACGPDTIFETTLYPYNNIAMLYDARSIIEGHMLDKQRVFANFVITAEPGGSGRLPKQPFQPLACALFSS